MAAVRTLGRITVHRSRLSGRLAAGLPLAVVVVSVASALSEALLSDFVVELDLPPVEADETALTVRPLATI